MLHSVAHRIKGKVFPSLLSSKPVSRLYSALAHEPVLPSSLLLKLKSQFPDSSTSDHLHSRVDLLLSSDPIVRVGIVPFEGTSRASIKTALDSVLADPLSSDQEWQTFVRNRNLSKNTVIRYSPSFDGTTVTHNSIVEISVPFSIHKEGLVAESTNENTRSEEDLALRTARTKIEFVEVNSIKDSMDHLLKCHRLVYLSSDSKDVEFALRDLKKSLPVVTPYRILIDYPMAKREYTADSTIKQMPVEVISSEMEMKANDLLRENPGQNADKYIKLHTKANIKELNKAVFLFPNEESSLQGLDDVANLANAQRDVAKTILKTCQDIVGKEEATTEAITDEGSEMGLRRRQWSLEAHKELQTLLEPHLDAMFKRGTSLSSKKNITPAASIADNLPWWKLYWKVDEVYSTLDDIFLRFYYLPKAQDGFKYISGRIDQFADIHHFPPAEAPVVTVPSDNGITIKKEPVTVKSATSSSSDLDVFEKSRQEILSTYGVELHNTALKALLTTIFGIQMPLIVLPLCAVYVLDYCTLYSAGSIMALGVAVGFSKLQKDWNTATTKFKNQVLEQARLTIGAAEKLLWEKWEGRVDAQKKASASRKKIIEELKQALEK